MAALKGPSDYVPLCFPIEYLAGNNLGKYKTHNQYFLLRQ